MKKGLKKASKATAKKSTSKASKKMNKKPDKKAVKKIKKAAKKAVKKVKKAAKKAKKKSTKQKAVDKKKEKKKNPVKKKALISKDKEFKVEQEQKEFKKDGDGYFNEYGSWNGSTMSNEDIEKIENPEEKKLMKEIDKLQEEIRRARENREDPVDISMMVQEMSRLRMHLNELNPNYSDM